MNSILDPQQSPLAAWLELRGHPAYPCEAGAAMGLSASCGRMVRNVRSAEISARGSVRSI